MPDFSIAVGWCVVVFFACVCVLFDVPWVCLSVGLFVFFCRCCLCVYMSVCLYVCL